ncbi:MAG: 50S ribosomal protein L23 [Clostridia bacterium]|jgi:large subunit ribosomal protein L23|nr:50S ribosomal protein L23 [Clostridia bacterium]
MANIQYYDVILKPYITEKSDMNMQENGIYTFLVHPESTKTQIKDAVEKMFDGVKVEKVRTINRQAKVVKRYGRPVGKKAKKKIAMVSLAEGSKEIEIFEA